MIITQTYLYNNFARLKGIYQVIIQGAVSVIYYSVTTICQQWKSKSLDSLKILKHA